MMLRSIMKKRNCQNAISRLFVVCVANRCLLLLAVVVLEVEVVLLLALVFVELAAELLPLSVEETG